MAVSTSKILDIATIRDSLFDRDSNLLVEEQDDETIANLLQSLREAVEIWMNENTNGLYL